MYIIFRISILIYINLYMLLDGNMMDIEPEEWTGIVGTDLDTYPAIKEIVDFTAGWST
jgi:hypothetical protein